MGRGANRTVYGAARAAFNASGSLDALTSFKSASAFKISAQSLQTPKVKKYLAQSPVFGLRQCAHEADLYC